jgi:hypothetical protein
MWPIFNKIIISDYNIKNVDDVGRNTVNVVQLWSQDSVGVTSDYVMGWTVQDLTLGRGTIVLQVLVDCQLAT